MFYGPPGTGKTYQALRFANWWVYDQTGGQPQDAQVQSITFHPSFSYEDYIEGLTASIRDGNVTYEIEDGVFKRVAETARIAYTRAREIGESPPPFVLIVDEINRGNLAQIFGETITQLEADKRLDQENEIVINLAHSGDPFVVPPNLYLIGTMNTADRSIALVDAALRRRFRFIAFPPLFEAVIEEFDLPDNPLEEGNGFEAMLWLSIVSLREMNNRIVQSADLGKGKQIGHTRLFGVESTIELRDTWRYDILPLLEEYYFGQFEHIRHELFDGEGDELFDWERKQIRDFSVPSLSEALASFVDGDVDITYSEPPSDSSSRSRRGWDKERFFEEVEASFEPALVDVYRDLHEFGVAEADEVGYGTGSRTGAMHFYWDEYNEGDYLVYELLTDGNVQFRFWSRDDYPKEIFQQFLEDVDSMLDEEINADFIMSDDFNGLKIPIERLRNEDQSEQLKVAVRQFVEHCGEVS